MSGVRSALARAACGLGVDAMARRTGLPSLLIVCYHGVRADESASRHWLLLPQSALERQLRWLRTAYDVLPIDEAIARLHAGEARRPMAAITFDDGYRSNATLALPLLQSLGLPATIYLTTGHVDSGAMLWTTWLDLVLQGRAAPPPWLSERCAPVAPDPKEALKRLPSAEREAVLARLREEVESDARVQSNVERHAPDFAMLTWDEVRSAAASRLLTFGGHTLSHPIVSRLADDDVGREIGMSMDRVAREVNAVTRTFAYPNGRAIDFDQRAVDAIRRHGGTAAVTTIEGINRRAHDAFALRRLVVGDRDIDDAMFRLRAAGLWSVAA